MKQNFLLIVTDQLTWRALPAYGNTYAKTPNIDRIAAKSQRFNQCYTPCPICQPARASFWTGVYPHETNVLSNGKKWPVAPIPTQLATLGETFASAGYEAVHFGKTHDAGALRGFTIAPEREEAVEAPHAGLPLNFDTFNDRYTTQRTVEYLQQRKEGESPFLLVADLVNPHNICGWVGTFADETENPWLQEPLPPLPENFTVEDMHTRPKAVQYICCSHVRQGQTGSWTPHKFRQYLAAYYAYLEMVDAEIGRILDALEESGQAENTTLVFFADHGDSMAARRRVTKQVDFYEEVARVPFMLGGYGVANQGQAKDGLCSLLDLFPTLCGLASIPKPAGLRGQDLSHCLQGGAMNQREYVVSTWHTEWGYTVSPGRMVRTQQYKYVRYLEGNETELYDLQADPLERHNLARLPQMQQTCAYMESLLQAHLAETGDNFEALTVLAPSRWRSHTPGYEHHTGITAPQEV